MDKTEVKVAKRVEKTLRKRQLRDTWKHNGKWERARSIYKTCLADVSVTNRFSRWSLAVLLDDDDGETLFEVDYTWFHLLLRLFQPVLPLHTNESNTNV